MDRTLRTRWHGRRTAAPRRIETWGLALALAVGIAVGLAMGAILGTLSLGLAAAPPPASLRGELAGGPAAGAAAPLASTVTYTATDGLQSWSGVAPIDRLELRLDPSDLGATRLSVGVPAAGFDSGIFLRDANARRLVFEVQTYPRIAFEATAVRADPGDLPDGSTRQVTLEGRLDLHGVRRDVLTVARVTRSGSRVRARGSFTVRLSDFRMHRPSFLTLRVDDTVEVAYDVTVDLAPVP